MTDAASDGNLPRPNPAQGGTAPHSAGPLVQLEREALKTMSPEEIVAAKDAGQLDNVLGMAPRPVIDYSQPTD